MAKKGPGKGKRSMFGRAAGGLWISGQISKPAAALFKVQRAHLVRIYREIFGAAPKAVSKANVIEYVLRGDAATIDLFLEARKAANRGT